MAERKRKLNVREDEFSLQGTLPGDRFLFFRRTKPYSENLLTDLDFGDQEAKVVAELLTDFLTASSGVAGSTIRVIDIASTETKKPDVIARHDKVVDVVGRSLRMLGREIENTYLDLNRGKFDSVFELR